MKAMALSDLIVMRRYFIQMTGVYAVIALVLTASTGSVAAGSAALAVMNPAMFVISIAAYDQINHWESFRLSLPLSRPDVVKGRYLATVIVVVGSFAYAVIVSALLAGVFSLLNSANILGPIEYKANSFGEIAAASALGAAVALWIPAVSLPLSLRFGLTRMTRFAPVIVAFAVALAFTALGNLESSSDVVSWLIGAWVFDFLATGSGAGVAILGALAASALIFAASLPLSLKLYEGRDL